MPLVLARTSVLSLLVLARACGEEPPAPAAVQSSVVVDSAPVAVAANVAPSHGGAIVAAGPAQLEVVSHASGEVYAYPADGLDSPARARVTTTVAVEGGTREVEMRWVPRERRYVGRVTGVAIVPGPATVAVVVDDRPYVGVSPILVVAPAVVVAAPAVVVAPAYVEIGYHGKHKYRGHGHGYGHGHGRGHGRW